MLDHAGWIAHGHLEVELASLKEWHVVRRVLVDSVTEISDTRRDKSDLSRFVSFTAYGN